MNTRQLAHSHICMHIDTRCNEVKEKEVTSSHLCWTVSPGRSMLLTLIRRLDKISSSKKGRKYGDSGTGVGQDSVKQRNRVIKRRGLCIG